jgi:GNAT superfamily N-acetyltransferase
MIRRMEERDVARMISMGIAMHAESIYARCNLDLERLREIGMAILSQEAQRARPIADGGGRTYPANLAAWVAEDPRPLLPEELAAGADPHAIVGMFVASCGPMWFGSDRVAGDLAFYVAPEWRGGITAVLLLRAFEAWARGEAEAKFIAPGISTRIDHERVRDLYLKLGYRPFGERFLKEV